MDLIMWRIWSVFQALTTFCNSIQAPKCSISCSEMTRDNEIPAIFNPRRVRAPSVVVTNDSPNGSFAGGGFTNILHSSNPQISRSDSISQPNDGNQNVSVTTTTTTTTTVAVTTTATSTAITNTNTTTVTSSQWVAAGKKSVANFQWQTLNNQNWTVFFVSSTPLSIGNEVNTRKLTKCKDSCCSELAQKVHISHPTFLICLNTPFYYNSNRLFNFW